ncbi:hypothetical protein MBLNU13_g05799t1 [Cladosporium sp. NU13]
MARRSAVRRAAHSDTLGRSRSVGADDSTRADAQAPVAPRHQHDEKPGQSPERYSSDARSRTTSSARLPTTRPRRSTPRTANSIHRTQQKEPQSDPDFEPGPTAYEIMECIKPATTPGQSSLVYDHERRQASSTRPQPTTSDRSSQLRSAEILALATTNGNGSTSAGDKLFMRVAKRATEKFLRLYYRGVAVGQTAMQMITYALRAGSKLAGLTSETLVYILRTVVPGVLVKIRETLTAEKTPEGSDHAPIPGAYPVMFERPEAAAEGLEAAAEAEAVGPNASCPSWVLTRRSYLCSN